MSMLLVERETPEGVLVSVCDADDLGETFEAGEVSITVDPDFYDGEPADEVVSQGAFDAGGPTNVGVPTVMWGRPDHNVSLLGDDYVTLRGVMEEARIVGRLAREMLTED